MQTSLVLVFANLGCTPAPSATACPARVTNDSCAPGLTVTLVLGVWTSRHPWDMQAKHFTHNTTVLQVPKHSLVSTLPRAARTSAALSRSGRRSQRRRAPEADHVKCKVHGRGHGVGQKVERGGLVGRHGVGPEGEGRHAARVQLWGRPACQECWQSLQIGEVKQRMKLQVVSTWWAPPSSWPQTSGPAGAAREQHMVEKDQGQRQLQPVSRAQALPPPAPNARGSWIAVETACVSTPRTWRRR